MVCDNASVMLEPPAGTALNAVASTLLNVKCFCDHIEPLIRSPIAIGLRFMTSKVMERVPVADWKTEWEVSLIKVC